MLGYVLFFHRNTCVQKYERNPISITKKNIFSVQCRKMFSSEAKSFFFNLFFGKKKPSSLSL